MDIACIILAAGKGTRMKSSKPKVLHEIAGRPIINLLIDNIKLCGIDNITVVVAPNMFEVEKAVFPCKIAVQKEQNGTADAVMSAMPSLEGFDGKILIMMGDEPLIYPKSIQELISVSSSLAVMGIEVDNPHGLGRLITDDEGVVTEIVEEKDADSKQKEIKLCNGGNYCVDSELLRSVLTKISTDNAQKEYYLTDMVKIATEQGVKTMKIVVRHPCVWGINDREQLAEHEAVMQKQLHNQ